MRTLIGSRQLTIFWNRDILCVYETPNSLKEESGQKSQKAAVKITPVNIYEPQTQKTENGYKSKNAANP